MPGTDLRIHFTRARLVATAAALLAGCGGNPEGEPLHVSVPTGASFSQVADSLAEREIIGNELLFRIYARVSGSDQRVQAGTYAFRRGEAWDSILSDLKAGRVVSLRLAIPEGWNLRQIGARLADVLRLPADSVLAVLLDSTLVERFDLPGPTLEGYLYPATYTLPFSAPLDTAIARMVAQYKRAWTPERAARADSLDLSQREVVTLASIIEKEAKQREEMPLISSVYHNRLRIGYPLQADPTVQYALGAHQQRLLYAHIDSVADNPYNTYRHAGLPPGPIASPSALAIDAALNPADADYLYFVARADGSHIFTRSLQEHNRAKAQVRREREAGAARGGEADAARAGEADAR